MAPAAGAGRQKPKHGFSARDPQRHGSGLLAVLLRPSNAK
jgi:hypothetical protein